MALKKIRYSKVSRRIMFDAKFRKLSSPPPNGQSLFMYLLVRHSTCHVPGVHPIGEAGLAEELGWPIEGFREAFAEAFRLGLVKADWEERLVWVPNAIVHNQPESPNVVKGWASTWDFVPECQLKNEIYQHVGKSLLKASAKAFEESLPKTIANPEPEPEPEPEAVVGRPPLPPPPSGEDLKGNESHPPTSYRDLVRIYAKVWKRYHEGRFNEAYQSKDRDIPHFKALDNYFLGNGVVADSDRAEAFERLCWAIFDAKPDATHINAEWLAENPTKWRSVYKVNSARFAIERLKETA